MKQSRIMCPPSVEVMEKKMDGVLPYVGMVMTQFAQVGLLVATKIAMADGMTTFTFTCYSNILSFLLLIPTCFFIYRSAHPPLFPAFLYGFFLLGLIGFLVQILGYTGLLYASTALYSAITNLVPGFTFIFAIILRMENFNHRSLSTQAKSIGTVVSIIGALVATLYQGPALLRASSHLNSSVHLLNQSSTWIIGGLLIMIGSVMTSGFIIAQAFILKKYPVELLLMLFYSCFVAILSAATSLIMEKDLSSWSLKSRERLIPIIYSGFFGNAFQVSIVAWCVRKRGPLFASLFNPLGVVISTVVGVIFLGESFYLGSLIGAIIIVIGFYSVIWGKTKEWKLSEKDEMGSSEAGSNRVSLLQDKVDDEREASA